MCSTLYRDYITRIDNVCVLGRRMEGSAQRCIVYSSENCIKSVDRSRGLIEDRRETAMLLVKF